MEGGRGKRRLEDNLVMTPLPARKRPRAEKELGGEVELERVQKVAVERVPTTIPVELTTYFKGEPEVEEQGEEVELEEVCRAAGEAAPTSTAPELPPCAAHFLEEEDEDDDGGGVGFMEEEDDESEEDEEEEDEDDDEESDDEDDINSEEEAYLMGREWVEWGPEEEELLESAVASFAFLPRTCTDKVRSGEVARRLLPRWWGSWRRCRGCAPPGPGCAGGWPPGAAPPGRTGWRPGGPGLWYTFTISRRRLAS